MYFTRSNYSANTLKSQVISSNIASIYYAILPLVIQGEMIRRRENNKRLKLLSKFHTFAQISRARRRAYHLDVDPSEIPLWTISTIKKWTKWFVNFNKPDFSHSSAGAMAAQNSNFSLEAEQSVIGGLMLKNDAFADVSNVLSLDDFYEKRHQLLFEAIQNLARQGQPFDPVTLSEQLEKDGTLNAIGGGAYVGGLASLTPTATNIMAYARIVKERALKRRLANLYSNYAPASDIKVIEEQLEILADKSANLDSLAFSLADANTSNDGHFSQLARLAKADDKLNIGIPYADFGNPIPLQSNLEQCKEFPIESLGDVLGGAVKGIIDETQCPLEMAASAVLASASVAVQSLANVQVRKHLTFPTSNFFCVLGETGERKSGVFKLALQAHEQFERQLIQDYKAAKKEYDKQLKSKSDDIPNPPIQPNLLVSEPTYEGIVKTLQFGQPTLGLFSDEGGRFLAGHAMSNENKIKTATGLSELWGGGAVSRSRSGDGTTKLYDRRLSTLLMSQPNIALQLLLGDDTYNEQGLMGRFLVCYPNSTQGTRFYQESSPYADLRLSKYWSAISQLLEKYKYDNESGELILKDVQLDYDAKQLWIKFHDDIEGRILKDYIDIKGFANKAAEHAARIACVIQFCEDHNSEVVSGMNMQRGIDICKFYFGEALRLTGAKQTDGELDKAQRVLDWLNDEKNNKFFEMVNGQRAIKHSAIYQRGPKFVRSAGSAMKFMTLLEANGHALLVSKGRSKKWLISPNANLNKSHIDITAKDANNANQKQKQQLSVAKQVANNTKLAANLDATAKLSGSESLKRVPKVDSNFGDIVNDYHREIYRHVKWANEKQPSSRVHLKSMCGDGPIDESIDELIVAGYLTTANQRGDVILTEAGISFFKKEKNHE